MAREQFMVEIEFILNDSAKAEPNVLGYWLRLNAYCAARLLGGRIKGAKTWTDGVTIRTVGLPRIALDEVTVAEVGWWEGDDLLLAGYDLEGERLWKKQSKGGREGNKTRWSNRTPMAPPTSDTDTASDFGVRDQSPTSDTDIGHRIRDGDSDSVETPPRGGVSTSSDAGAREDVGSAASDPRQGGESPPGGSGGDDGEDQFADPRLLIVKRNRAHLVDPKSGEVLSDKWIEVFEALRPDQIDVVFTNAKRLTNHEARFPSGFAKALEAIRREHRHKQRQLEQAAAEEEQRNGKAEVDAQRLRDRAMSQAQVQAVEAWLASPDGEAVSQEIYSQHASLLALARQHAAKGAGANLSLARLAKIYPALEPLMHIEADAGEGSAA